MAICLKSGWKWLIHNPEFHIALFFRACLNFPYNFKGHDEIFLISSHWLQQMGICNAQNQPSLDCCSHLPRDALKATDVASKNNAPDVQLIIGLHFPKQLQTGTRATAYAHRCVCEPTDTATSTQAHQQAHRHTNRRIQRRAGCSPGCCMRLLRAPLEAPFILFYFFFPDQRHFKLKCPEVWVKDVPFFYVQRTEKLSVIEPPYAHTETLWREFNSTLGLFRALCHSDNTYPFMNIIVQMLDSFFTLLNTQITLIKAVYLQVLSSLLSPESHTSVGTQIHFCQQWTHALPGAFIFSSCLSKTGQRLQRLSTNIFCRLLWNSFQICPTL